MTIIQFLVAAGVLGVVAGVEILLRKRYLRRSQELFGGAAHTGALSAGKKLHRTQALSDSSVIELLENKRARHFRLGIWQFLLLLGFIITADQQRYTVLGIDADSAVLLLGATFGSLGFYRFFDMRCPRCSSLLEWPFKYRHGKNCRSCSTPLKAN